MVIGNLSEFEQGIVTMLFANSAITHAYSRHSYWIESKKTKKPFLLFRENGQTCKENSLLTADN